MFSSNSVYFVLFAWFADTCMKVVATQETNQIIYRHLEAPLFPHLDSELTIGATFLQEPCIFYLTMTKFDDGHEEKNYVCQLTGRDVDTLGPHNAMPIKINGNDPTNEMLSDILYTRSGLPTLYSSKAFIDIENYVVSFPSTFIVGSIDHDDHDTTNNHSERRKLHSRTEGQKNILVLRVVAEDSSAVDDEATMSNKIFGTDGDNRNFVSQYNATSFGKLIFQPVQTIGNDGVLTVAINDTINGKTDTYVQDSVDAKMINMFNTSWKSDHDISHYLMIIPPGTVGSWFAKAALPGDWSMFNGVAYSNIGPLENSVLMVHEVGHNLGLGHSGDMAGEIFSGVDAEYDDTSCIMGGGVNDRELLGFNGPKSWQLGWYTGRYLSLSRENGGGSFRLVGAVDYLNAESNDDMVVIQITGGDSDDYYVAFNRKAGFNADTNEGDHGDLVLVTKRVHGTGPAVSWLEAELGVGESYTTEFDIGPLIIMVDNIDVNGSPAAYAEVTIVFGTEAPSMSLVPSSSPVPTFDPNNVFDLPTGEVGHNSFEDYSYTFFDIEVESDMHIQSISVLFNSAEEEAVSCTVSYRPHGTWVDFEETNTNFETIYSGTFQKSQSLQALPEFPEVPLSPGLYGVKLECSKQLVVDYRGTDLDLYNAEDENMRIKSGKYGPYPSIHFFDWKGTMHYRLRAFPSTAPSSSHQPSITPYPTLSPSRSLAPSYDPARHFNVQLGTSDGSYKFDFARAYFDFEVLTDIQLLGITLKFDSEAVETTSCEVSYRSGTANGSEGLQNFGTVIYNHEFTKTHRLQELPNFQMVSFVSGTYGVKIECLHNFGVRHRGENVETINGEDANVKITSGAYGYYYPRYKWDIVGSIEYILQIDTQSPTQSPTSGLTSSPTDPPTSSPTAPPTKIPTLPPTRSPTGLPTRSPTYLPTSRPTLSPTSTLTKTASPTSTQQQTSSPTISPSRSPTFSPTKSPTLYPTRSPTTLPTLSSTTQPTTKPSSSPKPPTSFPSISIPTLQPEDLSTDVYDIEVSLTVEGEIQNEEELLDFATTKLNDDCIYIEGCIAFTPTATEITELPATTETRRGLLNAKLVKIKAEITYMQDTPEVIEAFSTTTTQSTWPDPPESVGQVKVASSSYSSNNLERSTVIDPESSVSIHYVPSACKFPSPDAPPCYFRYYSASTQGSSEGHPGEIFSMQNISYWSRKERQWSMASFALKCCCQSTCYNVKTDFPRGGIPVPNVNLL